MKKKVAANVAGALHLYRCTTMTAQTTKGLGRNTNIKSGAHALYHL